MTEAVTPFEIAIGDEQLLDLHQRLARTRWAEAETVGDWSQGVPVAYLRKMCEYWRTSYDWRKREANLNRFPQFRTTLSGGGDEPLAIHFLHVRSPSPDTFPLILTHGWPGSTTEFMKVVGPLTDPAAHGGDPADAFDVVVPSLPGFGFSDKPTRAGWNVDRIARAWDELMIRLGYQRYGAQGGDWGSLITTRIGAQNLGRCASVHVTMPLAGPAPEHYADLTPEELDFIGRFARLRRARGGVLEAAEDPPADPRIRIGRLTGRPGGMDPREVLGVDRQRRSPRRRCLPRRAARQRDGLLAQRHRRILGASVLGELQRVHRR